MRRALAAALLLVALFVTPAYAADILTIYVSTGCDDANDGTLSAPVCTLDRVEELVAGATTDVEVRISQGLYVDNQTTWETYVPGHTISFLPVDYSYGEGASGIAGRPVFRSDGTPGYWLYARLPEGHAGGDTGLRFYYLQIEKYSSGSIDINGGYATDASGRRVPAGAGANRNVLFGMVLKHSGSKHTSAYGWGALVLAHSSDNVVENSHFQYAENLTPNTALIHGVYVEHGSMRNEIFSNSFLWISGGPAWFRNDANDNNVHDNTFTRTGVVGYYGEWSCGPSCADPPTNPWECASHGNVFHHNNLVTNYNGLPGVTWNLVPAGASYEGPGGCDNEGQARVSTYGNT
jgi:hypothetical protein